MIDNLLNRVKKFKDFVPLLITIIFITLASKACGAFHSNLFIAGIPANLEIIDTLQTDAYLSPIHGSDSFGHAVYKLSPEVNEKIHRDGLNFLKELTVGRNNKVFYGEWHETPYKHLILDSTNSHVIYHSGFAGGIHQRENLRTNDDKLSYRIFKALEKPGSYYSEGLSYGGLIVIPSEQIVIYAEN